MPAEHLLAIDAGSSGARCLIVRPGSGPVAAARRDWCYQAPPDAPFGWSFDPQAFWSLIGEATRAALAEAGLSGSDIAAVGVASQRLGLLVLDGDGESLFVSPNIDARAVAEGFAIDARLAERVYASAGKLPSLLLAPAKIEWLRAHHQTEFSRAAAVLAVGDWVAYRLTGELRSERSLAADAGLLNVSSGERDQELLAELGVPVELLPPLVSSTQVAGEVTASAAEQTRLRPGTPVVIAGGDTQCALAAMGIVEPGEAGIVAGWSCPLQLVTGGPRHDRARRTWVSLHVVPNRWLVESSAADAGRTWRWWCESLLGGDGTSLERAAHLATQAPAGARDALALLGPRAMNAAAMGVHLGGLVMTTPVGPLGRPELLRAGLENIAYALRSNLEQAEEVSGLRAERIALGGGFTRAAVFPHIVADVLGRPIEVAQELDVSARGATLLAARATGAAENGLMTPLEPVEPDSTAAETYQRCYQRWRRLGEALDRTMQELP